MKKIFLAIAVLFSLSIITAPFMIRADGLVPTCGPTCNESGVCTGSPCGICDFFKMVVNIYNFIVTGIATPLAVIALIIGGICILVSAGNPNLSGTGKKIIYAALIGLALVFCSYLIINSVLAALGYTGTWGSISC